MLIQILPIQIPKFWEVVKFAAINSDNIEEKDQEVYSLNLLQNLLSGKKHCYITQKEKQIFFVIIIEFRFDPMIEKNFIYFNNLYSFSAQGFLFWKTILTDLDLIAKNNSCDKFIGEVNNLKMQEILSNFNIPWVSKKFIYTISKEN